MFFWILGQLCLTKCGKKTVEIWCWNLTLVFIDFLLISGGFGRHFGTQDAVKMEQNIDQQMD